MPKFKVLDDRGTQLAIIESESTETAETEANRIFSTEVTVEEA